jgi:hypothetical protein
MPTKFASLAAWRLGSLGCSIEEAELLNRLVWIDASFVQALLQKGGVLRFRGVHCVMRLW